MSIYSFDDEGLHDTFRKSPQINAIVEAERLQVGQLADTFGQCPQAHLVAGPTEIKLSERPHVADAPREFLQLHAAKEVQLCEVNQLLSESFGERGVKISIFRHGIKTII